MQDSFYTQKTVKVEEPSDIKVRDLGNGDQRRNQEPHDHMRTMHGMDAMLNNNRDYVSGNFPKPQKKMHQTRTCKGRIRRKAEGVIHNKAGREQTKSTKEMANYIHVTVRREAPRARHSRCIRPRPVTW